MIQVGGIFAGGGGLSLDIEVLPALPTIVTEDRIIVIRDTQPLSIIMDIVQPAAPSINDIWIELSADETKIAYVDDNKALNARPRTAWYYDGAAWRQADAHIGTDGQWVQFSDSATMMGARHNTASASTVLERLGSAAGLQATAGVGTVAQVSDFDNMPIYRDIRTCNLSDAGVVTAWQGEAGFSRTTSNVMVRIPKFWYKVTVNGTIEEWWIADKPADGFEVHPAFSRGAPYADLDEIYVSAYECAAGYQSRSGLPPLTNQTRAVARVGLKGKGSRWTMLDVAAIQAINLLIFVEYANLNTQAVIAPGRSVTGAINAGTTDGIAGHTGRPTGTAAAVGMKWRDIENWWGNTWAWVDGLNISNGAFYFCLNPNNFSDDTMINYTSAGYTILTNLSASYITKMGYNAVIPFLRLPTMGGGSETSYYCDGTWTGTGWCVVYYGGSFNDGALGGASCWALIRPSTYQNVDLSCRSLYLPQKG